MNIEMIKHLAMSDKLREAWEAQESGTFSEVQPGSERNAVIAGVLRREHPEVFNLRFAGDCWVWCYAVQDAK